MLEGAVSLDRFCAENSVSRATCYREISAGRLEARKVGRKTVITKAAAKAWLEALPKFGADCDSDVAA
ncbi:DNA binding domain-containing protein, excisionase family [Bradyrhizobium sp. Ghvi]|uniref:helix-turn-helix domain-containing protein n=1 Tax=Bradyrhizobium sp. Ghvi TaxID=1855319 RepID=UPI0008EDBD54|nr:helix-turn-helix domain-containing protein [Bradyrhizobium sp. Ghvi]SFO74182.1 DNA binding domain-containing protein, excisionase family [Bradyrhizobium sp. Ghvi]